MSVRETAEDFAPAGRGAEAQAPHSTSIADAAAEHQVRRGYQMLACMILLAILSQFFRSSNGLIAPNLMADLSLTSEQIGYLSGAFFIVFAVLQLPVGVLLDRHGGRSVLSWMLILAVAGSLIFAVGQSYEMLLLGRLLIGIGCAGLMVGSLVILSRWLPPDRYTFAMALLFAFANVGTFMASWPLGASTALWGWRNTFIVLALMTALFGLLFYWTVRDAPRGHAFHSRKPEPLGETVKGLLEVWRLREVLLILPMIMIGYAIVQVVLGLWGGPYLYDVYKLDEIARGEVMAFMTLAFIAGTMAYGPLDRWFNTRKGVVIGGASATIATLLLLAVLPALALWQVTLLLCLFCFVGAFSLVVMSHGLALIPQRLSGRGVTTLNMGLMGGAALLQAGTGPFIEFFSGQAAAPDAPYRALFGLLAGVVLVATAIYARTQDVRPLDKKSGDKKPG